MSFDKFRSELIRMIETKEIYKIPEDRREYLLNRVENKIIDYISKIISTSIVYQDEYDVKISVTTETLVPTYELIVDVIKECKNIKEIMYVFYEFSRISVTVMMLFSPYSAVVEEMSDYWYEIKDRIEKNIREKLSEVASMYGNFSGGAA